MKKLIVVLMVLLLTFPVYASNVNVRSMKDEELIDLKAKIEEELAIRELDESGMIYSGAYVVGQDIKAGSYMFFTPEDDVSLFIYSSQEAREKSEGSDLMIIAPGSPYLNTLHDGQVIVLSDKVGIKVAEAFWQP